MMYTQRLRRNLLTVIHEHGFNTGSTRFDLTSVGFRHLWNVDKGLATMRVDKLEAIADEIGADFLDFFRE